MFRKALPFILLGLLAGGILLTVFHRPKSEADQEKVWATQTYQKIINQPDPELLGPVTVIHSQPGEAHEWRLATFQGDGKTPAVYKDLMKPRYYGSGKGPARQVFVGIAVEYHYFRADGTLERKKRVDPMSGYGASCEHIIVEELYSADGKTEISSKYIRENGDVAATFQRLDKGEEWRHYRKDGSLARIHVSDDKGWRYVHYRLDGKTIWWTYDGKTSAAKVFFDWHGNPMERQFSRVSLQSGGYSYGPGDPPLPVYEDTYTRADGTAEYRQTWVVGYWGDESFNMLSKLEFFSADGKQVVRTISFEPAPLWKPRKVVSDSDPAQTPVPEFMHHGFNLDIWNWTDEHAHDI